jgi:hypothetical protein
MFSHPVSDMVSANSAEAETPEFLFLSGIAPSSGTMAFPPHHDRYRTRIMKGVARRVERRQNFAKNSIG